MRKDQEGRKNPLCFRRWWEEAPMKIGAYNIPVPDNTELVTLNVIIVPMLGFDTQGYRLGYGGGYYDRTILSINPRPLVIGIAFEVLQLDNIYPNLQDAAMDFIITEAGIYQVSKLLGHSSVRTTEKHYAPLMVTDIPEFKL